MVPAVAAMGIAQMVGGGLQALFGTRREKRATNELENLQTPTERANAAVNNYYANANVNPYDSAVYKQQMNNINRSAANALRNAQDRQGALAAVGNIVRGTNDATLDAAARAEQIQNQKLAAATGMKVNDDRRLFDINKMLPYQKKYMLLAQKAAGGTQLANAGWKNLFGGGQTLAMGAFGNGTNNEGVY